MPLQPGTASRAPGSFSPLPTPQASSQGPGLRRVDSSYGEDSPIFAASRPQNVPAQRSPNLFATFHANSSSSSLQNFSRPTASHTPGLDSPLRTGSPLTLPPRPSGGEFHRAHTRKHSNSQGFFEPALATTTSGYPDFGSLDDTMPNPNLTASQIAAQAAMHQGQHSRQRSQTLPIDQIPNGQRKLQRGAATPPMLSLTEASVERQNGFGNATGLGGQIYRNGLLGGGASAAATAANVVFQRSPQTSPIFSPSDHSLPYRDPEKLGKAEKPSKVKLFSRPGKISIKDTKEKALPSPNKMGSYALSSLQRSNMSTASLADSIASGQSSMYSMANSSSATIRPIEVPAEREKEKDKEKKHHFLSRQKHKLSSKDDHHLPLSSAASNSRPADPNAPSSLYNFSLPPSPGPTATSFAKSMSGLDLRHGGRALREKKKEEKAAASADSRESEAAHQGNNEWPGPSSFGSTAVPQSGPPITYSSNLQGVDTQELTKYGLSNMTADDAWPFLKAKLLIIFEGEDLRLPVEDFNRLVTIHLQRCIQKRAPNLIVEDLRDLLMTGFSSLDQTLRRTTDDRLIPHLVELWLFTFTSILPYMQAVFLPLDLEFSGHGPLMNTDQARDFWGALPLSSSKISPSSNVALNVPASQILEVRRIVLTTYRDSIIIPRFETLKTIFSRLSLDSINLHPNLPPPPPHTDILSSSPDSFNRPGTAMSLDPSMGSYNSQTTTLLGGGDSSGARSRAISNVSFGSDTANAPLPRLEPSSGMLPPSRPFTPSSAHPSVGLGVSGISLAREREARDREREQNLRDREREANAIDSKLITETVGRMLQCMSVLASVGSSGDGNEDAQAMTEELCRGLKLNWLGRGRTGRNRRGLVGARVRRDDASAGLTAGVAIAFGGGSRL